jgi:hypothetical protein
MASSGSTVANRSKDGSGCLSVFLFMIVLLLSTYGYYIGYDLWSRFYIAPQLSKAEAAANAEHFAEALGEALPLLRQHPDNPRLLYFVSRTYWILDQRPLAAFYARAYLRTLHKRDPEQLDHLGQLLAADSLAWPYFKDADDSDTSYSWLWRLSLSPEAKATLSLDIMRSPSEFVENIKLYRKLPRGWAKSNTVTPAALLTQPALVAEGDNAGYVNVDGSVLCTGPDESGTTGPRRPKWCSSIFRKADLWKAVSTGRLTIDYPKGGEGCCTLTLDDPDLRPMDEVVADFLARREKLGKGDPETSAEGVGSLLDLRQRVLLKQSYLFNFAAAAEILPHK